MSATKTTSKKPAVQASKTAAEPASISTKPIPEAAPPKAAPKVAVSAPVAPKAVSPKKPARKTKASGAPKAVAKPDVANKPVGAAKPVKEPKSKKPAKVRDSFTMPEDEYGQLDALKARSLKAGRATKKSEILRAGLQFLAKLGDAELLKALNGLPAIKIGRPKK